MIDRKGYPCRMFVPDPRSFAIHKLWLSEQPGRRKDKAKRDREQALLVAGLVVDRLQKFKFDPEQLKMFPKKIVENGLNGISIASGSE